jgi:integrase
MGTLFKKKGSKNWQMGVTVSGQQRIRSTHTPNKRIAEKLLAQWETQVFEGRFHLPRSISPFFEDWADECLRRVTHPKTQKRYASSIGKLKAKLSGSRISSISGQQIEDYIESRLKDGVEAATINHDLRVLRRLMRLAERKRLITRNPFLEIEFLKPGPPRMPHIVTFAEEEKILAVAPPFLRALVVLILETGLRSHREALSLLWSAIDFTDDFLRVNDSKTRAGIRCVPLSTRCKRELLRWREILGPEFSAFVFPNIQRPGVCLKDIRHAWAKTLADAGLEHFWLYNLRHSYTSRLSAAGVADLFVAQMIGHSSPGILQKYSKAIDEFRRDAVRKLEDMRLAHEQRNIAPTSIN